jgi:TRAP-type mannitol/chloroaromatic compound transport system permease small subunit
MTSDAQQPQPEHERSGPPNTGGPERSWFGTITAVLNVCGTLLIIAMAIAVNADVIGRDFFNHPIAGVNEFLGLSIVAVVFLQMANTLREGRHVSNDIIMSAIGVHHPRVARAFYGLFHLIGAGLMLLIVSFVWPMFVEMYQSGYFQGTTGVIEIPIWPFVLPVIIGGIASIIQYLLLAGQEFALAFGLRRMPG